MVKNIKNDTGMMSVIPTSGQNAATPNGVLKSKTAVCVGYATTFRLFMQMMEGKTSFLVTHRMGAARLAEKIIVMQGGRICAFGTHEQLYGTCEEYQKLWDAQADAY